MTPGYKADLQFMELDVVVVGAAGVDTLVYLPEGDWDPNQDSTMVHTVDTVGQAGAFTARGFARLGWRTGFIGVFGDDWAGEAVRSAFDRDGVGIVAESLDPQGTARSVNLMSPDGRRRAFYDGRGHMAAPVPPSAAAAWANGPRLAMFHLSDWCRHLLPRERLDGLLVASDLQDVHDPDDAYRADFVAGSDVLFASTAHLDDPPTAARLWFGKRDETRGIGPRLVVFGMGARGAMAVTRRAIVAVPPPRLDLPVVDTNGAGDGLATGVLDWLLNRQARAADLDSLTRSDLTEALGYGQCLARWTSHISGSDGLATRADLTGMLAHGAAVRSGAG